MFMKRGATKEGADAIGNALSQLPDDQTSPFGNMLDGGDAHVQATSKAGTDVLSQVFGGSETSSLVDKIASYARADKAAVGSLLGVAGAGALGTLKTAAKEQNLDTAGVLGMLARQKDDLAAAIPFLVENPINVAALAARRIALDMCSRAEIIGDESPQMIGIICRVHDDMPDAPQTFDQTARLRAVTPLAGGDCKTDRQAECIHSSVNLGGQATFGSAIPANSYAPPASAGSFNPLNADAA
jgi:hypothetical protein